MKSLTVCALALLLVSPALARPNLVEPIYLRRRSNPLEIVEESVETSTLLSSQPAAVGQTSTEKLTSTGTTPASGSSTSSTSAGTSTHQPRYQTTNDGLSSDSLIKEFLLKNLANLQGPSVPPQPPPPETEAGSEEQNTLRSVSPWGSGLGYPGSGSWDPPEKTYVYPVKTEQYGGSTTVGDGLGQKRKPVIQKIMTKWSDKTSDVFNVEYSTPPVSFLRPVSQVYSNFGVTPGPVSIVTHSGTQYVTNFGGSPEILETNIPDDVYQVGPGPISTDALLPVSSSGTKNQKKQKKKNKIKIVIKPTVTTPNPLKQPLADPDRPDPVYSSEFDPYGQQNFGPWDPYDDVAEASPYDEAGNLKGESVTDAASDCNEINISVNGKQGCNEIQIAINPETENPSPTKQGDLTKTGPGVGSAALAPAVLSAVGAAGALAAAPQSAAAPVAVANDIALAAPLAAGATPLAVNPVAPVVPALFPPPVAPSLLNTPISNIVSNIIRPPVRLGGAGNPAATIGNGIASNGNKHKVKPGKPSHGHHSSSGLGAILPDASHALVGMLAALSAMTPMNMFVLGLTSLPVLAMLVGTLAAGMYMYKSYYPVPVKHYTTTVLVQKKPSVSYHWTRRPVSRPRPTVRYSWVDHDHSPAIPVGWDYDRRSMRHGKTRTVPRKNDPYRFQQPASVTR
ncbi:hypothetical protein ZHAS_00000832 [Anopheles sinensis]|uniref:Uncharacterized protein n=1 Tax=Anopheles sinensis TaxID=74873 RepID=A0A084VAM1_ANOSI|nr:hypothetical protein ZHAS_00000832 [Anopheles sinensis]